MSLSFAKLLFVVGTLFYMAIRVVFMRNLRTIRIAKVERASIEKKLLFLGFIGTMVLPIVYIATPFLSFADYAFSPIRAWVGVCVWVLATLLFWKSHKDLGVEWSPVLAMRENHQLITQGIYRRIRHPMYASVWLFVIAQALLLPNWIAGGAGILSFAVLYFSRVKPEEHMLERQFGSAYEDYRQVTGRLLPKLARQGAIKQ